METRPLIILFCVCTAFCFPSRPLNERAPELAWQAWLLVDDQQNKQSDYDGILRRRITPKSVFIAPTFSPESLPPCADGYRSDPMGRCIKIIKLDEAAHLDFLLQKLNEKFGNNDYEYDEEVEEIPTPGPFQVNIPLGGGGDGEDDTSSEQESDIAIVVAPTNGFDPFKLDKRDDLLGSDTKQVLKEETTSTGPSEETTTFNTISTTTDFAAGETTTDLNLMELASTTVDEEANTEPTQVVPEDASTETSTTTDESTTQQTTDFAETTTEVQDLVEPITTTNVPTKGFVRFPDDQKPQDSLLDVVRFPEKLPNSDMLPQNTPNLPHKTRDTTKQFEELFNDYIRNSGGNNERLPFLHQLGEPPELANGLKPPEAIPHHQQQQHVPNHRNRDKHLFLLPPRWSGDSSLQQKPLVLRFSRKHAYVDTQQFKQPDYYRSVPPEDLSYYFGVKHRQRSHR